MVGNLHQVRRALLGGAIFWLGLAVFSTFSLSTMVAGLALIGVAVWLYRSSEEASLSAALLALLTLGVSAIAVVLLLHRLEWLSGWSWLPAVITAWMLTIIGVFRHYRRLITVPLGIQYVYTGLIGRRTVEGYRKIPPPLPFLEHLLAVVPTRRLKLDFSIEEVGVQGDAISESNALSLNGTGPPSMPQSSAIRNLHRLDLAIELSISPDRWWMLNLIPCNDLISQLRVKYGGQGRNVWHDLHYWSDLATGYVQEIAEEQTRKMVHSLRWSALDVMHRRDELAEHLYKHLRNQVEGYGIVIHSVDVINVMIDPVETMRRTREIELLGETWQRQQELLLERFNATLRHLGLNLMPEDIERLCRVHLWDLIGHLQRYGHLNWIVRDLVNGSAAFTVYRSVNGAPEPR